MVDPEPLRAFGHAVVSQRDEPTGITAARPIEDTRRLHIVPGLLLLPDPELQDRCRSAAAAIAPLGRRG
jgi:hypothetical protein